MIFASTQPHLETVMDRSVLPGFRLAGTVLLAAILVTACDSWPFGSEDPTLTWETTEAQVLNHPLGHVDVERESGSIHLEGQFELPVSRTPADARLVATEFSEIVHVETGPCPEFCLGAGSRWWDFAASISGLEEGPHGVRLIVDLPSRSDTIFADTVVVP